MITLTIKDFTSPNEARKNIAEVLRKEYLRQTGVDVDILSISLDFGSTPCGCVPPIVNISEVPLEDFSCACGKTKLLEVKYNTEG